MGNPQGEKNYEGMMNDLSDEHKKVTITLEKHPFYSFQWMSVHPCRHAYMMKQMIQFEKDRINKTNSETTLSVQFYFLYFIKFLGCILPSVNFDYTMNT